MNNISRGFAALGLLGTIIAGCGSSSSDSAKSPGAGAPAASGGADPSGAAGASGGSSLGGAAGGSSAGSGGDASMSGSAGAAEPIPMPKRCSDETELGALAPSSGARVVTAGGTSPGKTASLVGFSATDVDVASNAVLWARYSGAATFRTFGSVQPDLSNKNYGDGVTSEASFNAERKALSAAPLTSSDVTLKDIESQITSGKAYGVVKMAAAVGAPLVVEIKTITSLVPLTGVSDAKLWSNKWEVWKNYFAVSFVYAHDYGASRFEIYNEPDLPKTNPADPQDDYAIRAPLAGDAIQMAVQAANALLKAKDPNAVPLVPIVIAPTSATGPGHLAYGDLVVKSLNNGPLGAPAAAGYTMFQGFGYHSYGSDGFDAITKVTALHSAVLAAKLPDIPWFITEFNAECTGCMQQLITDDKTGAYPAGQKTYAGDLPDFSRRLTEKAIGYAESEVGPMNLYAFNFLSTVNADGTYTNNGLHWANGSLIGGDSLAGAAYRLTLKHFGGSPDLVGRDLVALTVGADPDDGGNSPNTLFEAVYDERYDAYFILASNHANTTKKVFFDLGSLGLPASAIATVIDADADHHGEVTHRITLSAKGTLEITQGPDAISLISIPRTLGSSLAVAAIADATLAPGTQSAARFGDQQTLQIAANSTAAQLRAALVAFQLPAGTGSIGEALLELTASADVPANTDVLHVYGVPDTGWTDDAQTGVRWADVGNLKTLADTAKYTSIEQNPIQYMMNGTLDPALRIAATGIASGSLFRVDVTDYVREQAALGHTRVSLLLVREVNHHSDAIAYSAAFHSRESDCGAPMLTVRSFSAAK